MAAYIFFQRLNTKDVEELAKYAEKVGIALQGQPIKPLAFMTKHENLEGPFTETAVLAEFPSIEAAKAWYFGDTYTAIRQHRLRGGDHMAVLFEGNPD